MDTSDYPSMPNLAQMHARLASDNRRVEAMIDAQLDGIEQLFVASTAEDWEAVAEATRKLAAMKPSEIAEDVIQKARLLCKELDKMRTKPLKAPKHLANLLAVCRDARHRSK